MLNLKFRDILPPSVVDELEQLTINLKSEVVGTLPVSSGGLGLSSISKGDLLYGSATDVLSTLAGVATGNALISGGVSLAPSWGKIGLTTHVNGVLPVANGGTNASSFTAGSILFAGAGGTSVAQDNANLFWDDTNNRFGVGIASLTRARLEVLQSGVVTANANSLFVENTATNVTTDDVYKAGIQISVTGAFTGGAGGQTGATGIEVIAVSGADLNTGIYLPITAGLGIGTNTQGWPLRIKANSGTFLQEALTGTNALYQQFSNTGGTLFIGLEGSAGGLFGTTAYAAGIGTSGARALQFATNNAVRTTLDINGNFLLGTTTSPSTGTYGLVFADGTALATMGSNTAGLYADDVGGTVEMFAINEAGVSTQLTGAGSGGGSDWSVLTNGDTTTPELIFAGGDVIMLES